MVSEWFEGQLVDACSSVDYGLTESAVIDPVGPHFLRITDIATGPINWDSVPYVATDEATLSKYKLRDGDIVIARTGASTGASSYIKSPPSAVFASYLVRLKVKPDFDPRFVSYYLKSSAFTSYIEGVLGDKSAQPNASASTMVKAPLRAPRRKADQEFISNILGALDDKIELNRRMNGTLEAMAQALFKEWFVDGAKEEWPLAAIEQHFEAGRGLSYTSASLSESEGLPLHNLNTVEEGGGYKYRGIKWYTGEFKERHVVVPGDLVVTNVEQGFEYLLIGYGALVPKRFGERGLFSQDLCRMRPVAGTYLDAIYLYYLLRTPYFHDLVVGYSNGTTVNHLAIDGLRKPEFRVPPKKLHDAFIAQVRPMLERMELNEDENVSLAALRDTLLPKLMRGEVRVKELTTSR